MSSPSLERRRCSVLRTAALRSRMAGLRPCVRLQLAGRRNGIGQEFGVGEDRLQEVVEVVGDAAGELADRLHALGLAETFLGLGLTGKGLVELGVLCFELFYELQGFVTPPNGEIKRSGYQERGDQAGDEGYPT